jgi:hypothetical protein
MQHAMQHAMQNSFKCLYNFVHKGHGTLLHPHPLHIHITRVVSSYLIFYSSFAYIIIFPITLQYIRCLHYTKVHTPFPFHIEWHKKQVTSYKLEVFLFLDHSHSPYFLVLVHSDLIWFWILNLFHFYTTTTYILDCKNRNRFKFFTLGWGWLELAGVGLALAFGIGIWHWQFSFNSSKFKYAVLAICLGSGNGNDWHIIQVY